MKIKKFARLQNVEVDETAVLVEAANGAGKSSIINAYCWLFTGKYHDGSTPDVRIYNDLEAQEQWDAEVSVTYNGFEIVRKSSPVFETKRNGERNLKTRVNTTLLIDGVEVNNSEWCKKLNITDDFLLTATPTLFFDLEWKKQREIINRIAISENSELEKFNLKATSEKITKLKSSQNKITQEQKETEAVINSIKDVDIPEISDDLLKAKKEYDLLKNSASSEEIATINARNTEKINKYALELGHLKTRESILNSELDILNSKKFTPAELKPLQLIPEPATAKKQTLLTIDDYKKKQFENNFEGFPGVQENVKTIKYLKATEPEISGKCPLSGVECETAAIYAKEAAKQTIEKQIQNLIFENRNILERAYNEYLSKVTAYNDSIRQKEEDYSNAIAKNLQIEKENLLISAENKINEANFKAEIITQIEKRTTELKQIKKDIEALENNKPEPETLPAITEISEEILEKVKQYNELVKKQEQSKGVNENNKLKKLEYTGILKDLQSRYAQTYIEISTLQNEIDNYLEKVKETLQTTFAGTFKIDFEFYDQTLSGEYKETFRIFIDGKEFPNTALKIKAGIQLIAGFSKAFNINPTVFIDNAECTSQIDHHGLNCIELKFIENKPLSVVNS